MNRTKHKFIMRMVWTRKGVEDFENAVEDLIAKGYEPRGIEINKSWFRMICMAILELPPDKCDCQCPCCIEIHQGHCECECDCCKAHSHRDGTYQSSEDEE